MSRPQIAILPAVAHTSPLRVPSKVDLPAPLAPTSATSSLGAISMSIPKSTGPAAKPAVSPLTRSSGSAVTEPPRVSLAEVGLDDALVAQDDVWRPIGKRPAEVEDDDPLTHADDHTHHVFDEDDGHAGVANGAHDVERVVDLDVVEAGHDLVEQQQPGPGRHGPGDLESLAVGNRQGADGLIRLLAQPHQLEHAVGAVEGRPQRRPLVVAAKERTHDDVLPDRHRGEGLHDL